MSMNSPHQLTGQPVEHPQSDYLNTSDQDLDEEDYKVTVAFILILARMMIRMVDDWDDDDDWD